MKIDYHKNFLRNFKKRIANNPAVDLKFQKRLKLFEINPKNPLLHNHKLVGKKDNYWSFSVTGDIRVVYKYSEEENHILLYDIGSHNQVY